MKKIAFFVILITSLTGFGYTFDEQLFFTSKLKNGMTLIFYKTPNSKVSSLYLGFKAGIRYDEDGFEGESKLLEKMFFKGSMRIGSKNPDEEAKLIENLQEIGDKITIMQAEGKSGKEVDKLIKSALLLKSKIDLLNDENQFKRRFYEVGAKSFQAKSTMDFFEIVSTFPKSSLEDVMALEGEWLVMPAMRGFYEERALLYEEQLKRNISGKSNFERMYEEAFGKKWNVMEKNANKITMEKFKDYFLTALNPKYGVVVICGDYEMDYVLNISNLLFGKIVSNKEEPLSKEGKLPEKNVFSFIDGDELVVGIRKDYIDPNAECVLDILSNCYFNPENKGFKKRFQENIVRGMIINGAPSLIPPNFFLLKIKLKDVNKSEEVKKNLLSAFNEKIFSKIDVNDFENSKRILLTKIYSVSERIDDLARNIGEGYLISNKSGYLPLYIEALKTMTPQKADQILNDYFGKLKE